MKDYRPILNVRTYWIKRIEPPLTKILVNRDVKYVSSRRYQPGLVPPAVLQECDSCVHRHATCPFEISVSCTSCRSWSTIDNKLN